MTRLRPTGFVGIAVFVFLAATAAGTAIAYFTTTGAGSSATKTVSALAQPSITTATPGVGGTATLNWGAVLPPGTGNMTYKVERDGDGASGTCAPTLTTTTCIDSGLAAGTYSYVLTARWRSWTVSSASKAVTVTIGPVDRLVLSAASSTPTAGASDNLTITAKDAGGGTVTTYAGHKDLTFTGATASPEGTAPTVSDSSGADIAFGGSTTIDFSAGVATVSSGKNGAMKLYKSGATGIEVSDGSISTKTPPTVTVAPAAASKFALTAESTTPTVGTADNLTITALDAYGNTATSYAGSKSLTFSGAAASPSGKTSTVANSSGTATNFGSATSISFTAGVAIVSTTKNGVMRLYKSGEASIAASDGSVTTKTPLAVTVAPAPASKFVLAAATTTPAAGAVDNLTATAQDEYGNVATSYTGTKSLTFSGASASPNGAIPTVSDSSGGDVALGSPTTIDFSAGVATSEAGKNGAVKLYKGGSTSLKVTDGTLLTPTALVVTVGTTATRFLLAASTTTPTTGASVNLTITALDAYENTAGSYAGSKSLTFSGASVSPNNTKPTVANSSSTSGVAFGTATAISFTTGVATVSSSKNGLMKLYDAEEAAIMVSDGTISNEAPLKVTVSPATASKLVLAATTTAPAAGASDNLTTTAQDTYGNVATAYTGAKSLTFTGASASPSGAIPTVSDSSGTDVPFGTATSIDFSEGVANASGTKNGVMKLYKSGSTSVKAADSSFSVTLTVTVAAGSAVKFLLASSLSALTAGGSSNLTTTAQDTYGNVATAYTGAKILTYSGASTSPNGTTPVVVNSGNTATAFGSPTAINFTNGVASVSSSRNGLLRLYRAETANVSVSDGTISSGTVAVSVSPTTGTRWGITNISISAGTLGSNCLFTCSLTGLGNSGTVTAKVAVTDTYGNTVSGVGVGHAAKITTNGSGTISGTPLAIPAAGAAETATTFTYTSKSSGPFTEIVTAAAAEGTVYTAATLTATR